MIISIEPNKLNPASLTNPTFNTNYIYFTLLIQGDPVIIKKNSKLRIINFRADMSDTAIATSLSLHSEDFKSLSSYSPTGKNDEGYICLIPGNNRIRSTDTNNAPPTPDTIFDSQRGLSCVIESPFIHINNINDISLNSFTFSIRTSNGIKLPDTSIENLMFMLEII